MPPVWDDAQLQASLDAATDIFRIERMREPLEEYTRHFVEATATLDEVFDATNDLTALDAGAPSQLLSPRHLTAYRYLVGPPISLDDLKIVADVRFSSRAFKLDPETAARAIGVIQLGLDHNRFPWVAVGRAATTTERSSAIASTAALMAARRVLTARANESKEAQERAVKTALRESGFTEVPTRSIPTLSQAPNRGEFCGESEFGSRKADVVVRLWDDRVLALECKVSNSSTNSIKRLNNDTAVKATTWIREFGSRQVVPSAMLSGVFKLRNLKYAQADGLTIWWAHDLEMLLGWIEGTR